MEKYYWTSRAQLLVSLHLVVLANTVSAIQSDLDFKEKNILASFPNGYLETLYSSGPETKRSLFRNFPRILLPFNSLTNTDEFLELLKIARDLNQKATLEETIEVWISVSVLENNSTDSLLETLTKFELNSSNNVHPTVTALLMDCNRVNIVHNKILVGGKAAGFLAKVNQTSKFKFGLVVDLKYCSSMVPFDDIDVILFNDTYSTTLREERYLECYDKSDNLVNSGINLGFISKWPGVKDPAKVAKLRTGNDFLILNETTPMAHNISLVLDVIFDAEERTLTSAGEQIDGAWLQKPIVFNKPHLGVSVRNSVVKKSCSGTAIDPQIMGLLYDSFVNVILGDVNEEEEDPGLACFEQFVKYTAERKHEFVRNRSRSGGNDIFDDQNQMSVIVSTKGSGVSLNATIEAIQRAHQVADFSNRIHPSSISMIVINLDDYDLTNSSSERQQLGQFWSEVIQPSVDHIKKLNLNVTLVLNLEGCRSLNSSRLEPHHLTGIAGLMFQRLVSIQDMKLKAVRFTDQLKTDFESCKTSIEPFLQNNNLTKVQFRVKPFGCGDASYKDLDAFVAIGRIWEEMNAWGKVSNSVVFLDTAFDDPEEGEFCGWWRKPAINGSNPSANITFEDKKRIAYQLFEQLPKRNDGGVNILLVTILPIAGLFVIVTVASLAVAMRRRARHILPKEDKEWFFNGHDKKALMFGSVINVRGDDGSCTACSQPYDREALEIPEDRYKLDITKPLGSGEFGQVYRGTIQPKDSEEEIPVAVKMISDRKMGNLTSSLKGILSEIKILSYIGKHPSIVRLEGASTPDLRRGKVCIFLELCEMGSLEKHLRSYQPPKPRRADSEEDKADDESDQKQVANSSAAAGDSGYVNIEKRNVLDDALAQDMFRWAVEICNGMEFLTAKKVVHADLATRNVLLDRWKSAKIADFGLSRRLYDYTNYVKTKQEPLPWPWMSPESLRRWEFNEKTDVWAYGITLWEIYTLGNRPYPGMQWASNFCTLLEQGLRPEKPILNEPTMYTIMQACWECAPANRPTFSILKSNFDELAARPTPNYVNIKSSST